MSIGAALSGFAGGYQSGEGIKADRRRDDMMEKIMERTGNADYASYGGSDGYYSPDQWRSTPPTSGGGSSGAGVSRMTTADPMSEDMPGYQRAFLNAIALGESGGAYNVRYTPRGGATFEDTGQHPRIFEKGPHGPSSAAGRYQFTATTWDDMGGGAFTPQNQDRKAWELAVRDYGKRTGRDLSADLAKDGLTPQITKALAPTWAAFNSDAGRYINEYNNSYTRYRDQGRATNPTPFVRDSLADTQPKLPSVAETGGRGAGTQNNDPILSSVFQRIKGAS